MTPEQLGILQHALGVDKYGLTEYYNDGVYRYGFKSTRNYFCAGGDDQATCQSLVDLGYMREHRTTETLPYFNCSVTDAGIKAMRDESPAPPSLSRSQQRYREFLHADCGYSFIEWLRARRAA